ncbi:hypothetical protein AB990_18645 [Alkalihalobacillus pseudalcaliphilus]|nr:hypothetical protein AB990_18645 [Alkalihalobacillus pseudalcaliphilus]
MSFCNKLQIREKARANEKSKGYEPKKGRKPEQSWNRRVMSEKRGSHESAVEKNRLQLHHQQR